MDHRLLWDLWKTALPTTDTSILNEASFAVTKILGNWSLYKQVGDALGGVPPYVVGCLHYREASFDFKTHLANGDPLWNSDGKPIATTHVPSGLGPFDSWVSGAVGALDYEGWKSLHWDLVNALENLHGYNGWGPEKYHNCNSGYLWAGTQHYKSGMYIEDGAWDPEAIDHRPGCALLLMGLKAHGVDLNEIEPS